MILKHPSSDNGLYHLCETTDTQLTLEGVQILIIEYLVLEDGITVSMQGTHQFLKRYHHYKTIARKLGYHQLFSN